MTRPLERASRPGPRRRGAAPRAAPRERPPARPERILVTKQHNQLGDFILATPILESLAAAYPGAAIDYLASPVQAEAAGLSPTIRRVWLLAGKGISGRGRSLPALIRGLRRERYDLAIVLVTVSYSTTSALIAALSGARYRIAGRIAKSPPGAGLFHAEVTIPEEAHETDRVLAHLAALGIEPSTRRPRLAVSDGEVAQARRIVRASLADPGEILVGIHPGAGKLPNRWPAAAYGGSPREETPGARWDPPRPLRRAPRGSAPRRDGASLRAACDPLARRPAPGARRGDADPRAPRGERHGDAPPPPRRSGFRRSASTVRRTPPSGRRSRPRGASSSRRGRGSTRFLSRPLRKPSRRFL